MIENWQNKFAIYVFQSASEKARDLLKNARRGTAELQYFSPEEIFEPSIIFFVIVHIQPSRRTSSAIDDKMLKQWLCDTEQLSLLYYES